MSQVFKLYTTIVTPWEEVLVSGVPLRDEESQGTSAVLCGTNSEFMTGIVNTGLLVNYVVEFEKRLDQMYYDIDDEIVPELPTSLVDFTEYPNPKYVTTSIEELGGTEPVRYGMFVKEVLPSEILKIEEVRYDNCTEVYRKEVWKK